MPDLLHRIALSSIRGLNTEFARFVVDRAGGLENFFGLSERQLAAITGVNSRPFSDAVRSQALRDAERELRFVEANSIRTLFFSDPDYPQRLLECPDAPLMLYCIGDTDLNAARFVSVVGTRHATTYGTGFVEALVRDLASTMSDPVVVVSGLAYGIDIAAHRAALNAGVPTIGVLAHGLNTLYPATHREAAVRMVRSGGMLMTDYRSIGATHRGNFLARNRIVAGLADCLVVAESDAKGGAMVTARLAGAYSRDVFALPGRVTDRYSRGCNSLIASNMAQLVTSAEEIMQAMRWPAREPEGTQHQLFEELTPEEEAIMEVLTRQGDATLGELTARVDMPTHRLMGKLIDMESRGLLTAMPGGAYRAN